MDTPELQELVDAPRERLDIEYKAWLDLTDYAAAGRVALGPRGGGLPAPATRRFRRERGAPYRRGCRDGDRLHPDRPRRGDDVGPGPLAVRHAEYGERAPRALAEATTASRMLRSWALRCCPRSSRCLDGAAHRPDTAAARRGEGNPTGYAGEGAAAPGAAGRDRARPGAFAASRAEGRNGAQCLLPRSRPALGGYRPELRRRAGPGGDGARASRGRCRDRPPVRLAR